MVYIDYDRNSDYSYKAGLDEIYYWIISLREKKVYGPMLLEEYNILCKEKNIQLKFENNKFVNKIWLKLKNKPPYLASPTQYVELAVSHINAYL